MKIQCIASSYSCTGEQIKKTLKNKLSAMSTEQTVIYSYFYRYIIIDIEIVHVVHR